MSEWIDITLEEVATIQIGGTPTRAISSYWSNEYGSGFPWVSIADLKHSVVTETKERITERGIKNSNTKLINKGTLIMSFKLSIGRVAMTGIDLFTNEAIAAIIPKDNRIDSNLLYYILPVATQKAVTDTAVKGATLNKSSLGKLCLRVPSEPRQQEKIAEILQTVDRAIAHTEALIEKYHQIKAGLMHDLFTRGIGADGKLRPTREEAPELYQESAIGWIPQTWVLSTLDQEVRIIDCKHVTPIYCDDGYPIIRPRNIRSDGLDFENVDYISPCDFKKLTDIHAPKKGDIIYSRNASFGIPCYVETEREFAIGQDVVVMTQITTDTKYIYYLLKSDLIWSQISRLFAGSTFSRINLGDIREFLIPVPREHEQIEIAVRLSSIDEKIDREIEKKNKSYKLKAGLMHDLLTGKVPVKVNPSEVSHV